MEMVNVLSQDERTLLRRYFPQMETAAKHNYYTAIKSTDMGMLQNIYKRHIDPTHTPRVWCSACCIKVLRGLYEFARKEIYGDIER